ncbi:MAG: DUF296 domain-containing protein [Bacillota bacterium]
MKYNQGTLGRIFVAKAEHGDNLLEELRAIATKENISTAVFLMIGALKKADIVSGPQECTVPPIPIEMTFGDGREVLGMGTIFSNSDSITPELHVHGAFGRDKDVLMGCLRGNSEVYLVMEIIILEITNTGAFKQTDKNGLMLLDFI